MATISASRTANKAGNDIIPCKKRPYAILHTVSSSIKSVLLHADTAAGITPGRAVIVFPPEQLLPLESALKNPPQ